jgi:hypothetical protein
LANITDIVVRVIYIIQSVAVEMIACSASDAEDNKIVLSYFWEETDFAIVVAGYS